MPRERRRSRPSRFWCAGCRPGLTGRRGNCAARLRSGAVARSAFASRGLFPCRPLFPLGRRAPRPARGRGARAACRPTAGPLPSPTSRNMRRTRPTGPRCARCLRQSAPCASGAGGAGVEHPDGSGRACAVGPARSGQAAVACGDGRHVDQGRRLFPGAARPGRVWRAASAGSGELLHDSDFRDAISPPPFNWQLTSSTVGLAERQRGGRLHILFYGDEDGTLASQLLLLPPGAYRLSMRLAGDPARAHALTWSIWCDKAAPAARHRSRWTWPRRAVGSSKFPLDARRNG